MNGEEAQAADLLNRTLEITRLSVAEYKNANPRTRELCNAFADGDRGPLNRLELKKVRGLSSEEGDDLPGHRRNWVRRSR